MVKCNIKYTGDLRCELQHDDSGASVYTDAPLDNQGIGASFSPTDLMCSAVGACMATIMGIYARNNQLNLDGLRIDVCKHMSASPRRIAKIELNIHIPLPASSEHAEALVECAMGCPAKKSIHPDIELPIIWNWAK